MSDAAKTQAAQQKSGMRIPGFAQLQRLGKSLMLPIAVLPAAGILLRLGQPDVLGSIKTPVIGPFFQAMSAAGDAVFANLPLLFAVGVAIGFARKADGSTALAAVVGYVVVQAVFKTMSPIVLAGEVDKNGDQALINYSVFAGIVVGLSKRWQLPEAVRLGIAAAAAKLQTPGTSEFSADQVEKIYAEVAGAPPVTSTVTSGTPDLPSRTPRPVPHLRR